MSLVATWAAKEWRAQRGFLAGYVVMTAGSVASVLAIARWRGMPVESRPGLVLGLFLAVAGLGSLLAASAAVANEFGARDDALWRRLPGGLRAGVSGKLLFQALLLPALLLVGLSCGELFVLACGQAFVPPAAILAALEPICPLAGVLAALLPWVFAVALWLRRARLAMAATAVLGSAVAMGVSSILGVSRGLEHTLARQPWWLIWPWTFVVGIVVAYVSAVRGRRGGGWARSARVGAATAIVGMLPPAVWFGSWVAAYWLPDGRRACGLTAVGVTDDGRFAVVRAAAEPNWPENHLRVDLRDGSVAVLAGPREHAVEWSDAASLTTAVRGGWLAFAGRNDARIVEVASGESLALGLDRDQHVELPASFASRWERFLVQNSPLRRPGNEPVWLDGELLRVPRRDGVLQSVVANPGRRPVLACGHGLAMLDRDPARCFFDLQRLQFVALPGAASAPGACCVGGFWLFPVAAEGAAGGRATMAAWRVCEPAQRVERAVPQLAGAELLGLLDDSTVLFRRAQTGASDVLLAYSPSADVLEPIEIPTTGFADRRVTITDRGRSATYGQRDARGRRLLALHPLGKPGTRVLAVDPATRQVAIVLDADPLTEVLWCGADGELVCCEDYNRLVRYAAHDRRRTVIYPVAAD